MNELAPVVDGIEKELKSAVLDSLEEESEGLRKCEEELKVMRKSMRSMRRGPSGREWFRLYLLLR